jgi:ribosomal protein S8
MKLETAQKLATLDKHQIVRVLNDSGYITKSDAIEEILDIEIKEMDVTYTVRFKDDGSFEDEDSRCSALFVYMNGDKILADF